jgi:hypothetical protein
MMIVSTFGLISGVVKNLWPPKSVIKPEVKVRSEDSAKQQFLIVKVPEARQNPRVCHKNESETEE